MGGAKFADPDADLSLFGRVLIWTGIIDYLQQNFNALITGAGLGGFSRAIYGYVPMMITATGAHNNYLHLIVESGIAGFAAFLYIIFVLLKRSLTFAYNKMRKDRALFYGYFCGLCALLLTGLTQETFSVQAAQYNFLGFFILATSVIFANPAGNDKGNG